MLPIWNDLYEAGADVVLNGHAHNYERLAPIDPQGSADPQKGIREFVVGTGGRDHQVFAKNILCQRGAQRRHVRRAQADPPCRRL